MAIGYFWASVSFVVFLTVLAADRMGLFRTKNHMPVDGRTVLLTGASQGMGKSVARMLAAKGANIIIVARDQKRLSEALEEAKAAAKNPSSQRFLSISADVTTIEENTRMIKEATAWNNGYPPDIIWGIAGAAKPTLLLDSTIETMHSQMDINYWSSVYLARETLKAWLPSSSIPSEGSSEPLPRHLVLTSSIITFAGIAGYTPYGPSKAAMRSFSDIMRCELNFYNGARRQPKESQDPAYPPPPTDMHIHTVFPATISSPGLDTENKTKHDITHILEEIDPVQSPDQVAAGSIKCLERGDYLVVPHWFGKIAAGAGLQGSPRNSWWADTLLAWVTNVVWLYVAPDMENQVWNYGKKWGLKGKPKDVKA